LPFDSHFPFIHLERKFMHLGFHIYDVGFQSPNVEATRPLVFATALLLIMVVTTVNLAAIGVRNHLRRKYASKAV
jgi:phosphate transport system permease protein